MVFTIPGEVGTTCMVVTVVFLKQPKSFIFSISRVLHILLPYPAIPSLIISLLQARICCQSGQVLSRGLAVPFCLRMRLCFCEIFRLWDWKIRAFQIVRLVSSQDVLTFESWARISLSFSSMLSSKQRRMQAVPPMMTIMLMMMKEATRMRIRRRSSSSGSLSKHLTKMKSLVYQTWSWCLCSFPFWWGRLKLFTSLKLWK